VCKALHVLPREGGVLDQPGLEFRKLETILAAFSRWEDWEAQKAKVRERNRRRNANTTTERVNV
jgi:hypothetical protein